MNNEHTPNQEVRETGAAYESPAIESVLTADALEREVFYAGEGGPTFIEEPPFEEA